MALILVKNFTLHIFETIQYKTSLASIHKKQNQIFHHGSLFTLGFGNIGNEAYHSVSTNVKKYLGTSTATYSTMVQAVLHISWKVRKNVQNKEFELTARAVMRVL
jgi:hypothetical protein